MLAPALVATLACTAAAEPVPAVVDDTPAAADAAPARAATGTGAQVVVATVGAASGFTIGLLAAGPLVLTTLVSGLPTMFLAPLVPVAFSMCGAATGLYLVRAKDVGAPHLFGVGAGTGAAAAGATLLGGGLGAGAGALLYEAVLPDDDGLGALAFVLVGAAAGGITGGLLGAAGGGATSAFVGSLVEDAE